MNCYIMHGLRKKYYIFSFLEDICVGGHSECVKGVQVQLLAFWLLRASSVCVLLNISGPTWLFERGYVARRERVIVGIMEAEDRDRGGVTAGDGEL